MKLEPAAPAPARSEPPRRDEGCDACRLTGTAGLGGAAAYVAAQLVSVPRTARLHQAALVALSGTLAALAALRWRA